MKEFIIFASTLLVVNTSLYPHANRLPIENRMNITITNYRAQWPSVTDYLTIDEIPLPLAPAPLNPQTQLTGLVPVGEIRFSGDNQSSDTRRPQGVACYGEYIITSWYFRSGIHTGNCKLTITNADGWTKDVCPVRLQGTKYRHIDSHAGGLAVVGHFLYLADSTSNSLRVFDLRCFFARQPNTNVVELSDGFANTYSHLLPEVGQIFVDFGANLSHVSANSTHLILGNFYDAANPEYMAGGRSMVWELPIVAGADFSEVGQGTLHEPGFDRIQGALIVDGVMILSRSWSAQTMSLVVQHIASGETFSGTESDPETHNEANWLYGCEGLAIQGDNLITVTEFVNNRNVTAFLLDDVISLVDGSKTIEEHQDLLAAMQAQHTVLGAAIDYYESQIACAISWSLESFDASTFIPDCQ